MTAGRPRRLVDADIGTGPVRRRLGVLGTLVWDTIRHPGTREEVEAWGGIAYALAAFEEVLPAGWVVAPMIKVGRDLADEAMACLGSYPGTWDMRFVHVVPETNNRVELIYVDPAERLEILRGGVPGWSPAEVAAIIPEFDALYANFISGRELTLEGARVVRDRLRGPSYADLHSLFLNRESDGRRTPRYLPSCEDWAGCFDALQMNQEEFALFARGDGDPWAVAERVRDGRVETIIVTRGAEGVDLLSTSAARGAVHRERIPVRGGAAPGDPTGCGDVWGATCFAGILAGLDGRTSAERAHTMARSKLGCSGAEEFRRFLSTRVRP